jgi:hypothetical protein
MNKLNLPLLSFFYLFFASIYAQPTLNNSVFPIIGDVSEYGYLSSGQNILPGNSGENITWDFSNLVLDLSTTTISYLEPSTTPYFNSFPEANMAIFYSNNQIEYTKKTADSMIHQGQYITGIDYQLYSNTRLDLKVPLNLGESFTDDFATNFTNPSGDYIVRTGTIESTFDGYGTLILPEQTIPNCIRIKTTKYSHDIVGSSTVDYYDTLYHWYSPNIRNYLLHYNSFTVSGTHYSFGYLRGNFHLNLDEINDQNFEITISPNPSTELITISIFNVEDSKKTCYIFDASGRVMKELTLTESNSIVDISELKAGIYFVRIGNSEQKFVKE